ncbi:MAG: succinyldiaminopimelate transaminase [Proteobacteria bacterium]|jgi:N-succinyldiaminopimelate aminotransferase|nr:succinyldiaminopimelate transaminase [Pseudomonadota bacterium]
MNPLLQRLQPYPFERLRALHSGIAPDAGKSPINLSIGEPRHPTPPFIVDALARGAVTGLANYPMTRGVARLREAIAAWLTRRHAPARVDAETEVLPVLGSREALFAFAQTVADASRPGAVVVVPNPFYQIYEGAALLAGVDVHCVNADPAKGFRHRWQAVAQDVWARTQLLYVCSPDNPTGSVLGVDDWKALFELSDRHGFAIASDECYSEIYFDESRPPLGALAAASMLGRAGYPRLAVFGSLSKRSNAPGLRSGFVAGDARLIEAFLRYRTYHGSAMSAAVAEASIAAWSDETHVVANRALYAAKFARLAPRLAGALPCAVPAAGFYLWATTPTDDAAFARRLYAEEHVLVLPGSFLGREANGVNPGTGRIRVALVAPLAECEEAIERIVACAARVE